MVVVFYRLLTLLKAVKTHIEKREENAIRAICGVVKTPRKRNTTSAQLPSPFKRKLNISIIGKFSYM